MKFTHINFTKGLFEKEVKDEKAWLEFIEELKKIERK